MNKWVALVIGIVIVILGCVAGASIGRESRTVGLVVFFAGHLLALLIFIIFLRKHTPVLLAGIMFQVIVLVGLLLAGSDAFAPQATKGGPARPQQPQQPGDAPAAEQNN